MTRNHSTAQGSISISNSARDASTARWRPAGLQAIPENTFVDLRESLEIIVDWQDIKVPSRWAIGHERLRNLSLRVREQPTNFVVIIYQSIKAATSGQQLCATGWNATRNLIEGEDSYHREQDRTTYTNNALENLRTSASQLDELTKGVYSKFRLLRIIVLELHTDLNDIDSKPKRSILARLSYSISKNPEAYKTALRKAHESLEQIENSLNQVIRWWQKAISEVTYLHANSESRLLFEKNTVVLDEVMDNFAVLEKYFDDYTNRMCIFSDEAYARLKDANKEHFENVKSSTNFGFSKTGKLVPESN